MKRESRHDKTSHLVSLHPHTQLEGHCWAQIPPPNEHKMMKSPRDMLLTLSVIKLEVEEKKGRYRGQVFPHVWKGVIGALSSPWGIRSETKIKTKYHPFQKYQQIFFSATFSPTPETNKRVSPSILISYITIACPN